MLQLLGAEPHNPEIGSSLAVVIAVAVAEITTAATTTTAPSLTSQQAQILRKLSKAVILYLPPLPLSISSSCLLTAAIINSSTITISRIVVL
jgi:hypothetical protein